MHEAHLSLASKEGLNWESEDHFYRVTVVAMRQILIEHARKRKTQRRGGGALVVRFSDNMATVDEGSGIDILELDEALVKLSEVDPIKSQIVELRYFGGLLVEQTAGLINIPISSLHRHWRAAKER